jgi:UDP-N-acetylmuramoyl-L-alanyl-D-glutamate--2,6-diaminopimelate ligase
MRLRELLAPLDGGTIVGDDVDVTGVTADSREVRRGDLFFALAGHRDDGLRHLDEAIARGARALVVDARAGAAAANVTIVRAADPRRLLGPVASRLAGDPSADVTLVGVTGTNGKTTTTYLLEAIWRAAGHRPGVLGTIAYRFGGASRPAPLTTPEAHTLQTLLAEMRAAGTTHVAMEASSHALAQDRVAGCRFDVAVFTNLTRDHLDFHGDFARYAAAKDRLFLELLPASGKRDPVAVVNVDDPHGERLAAVLRTRLVTVGHSPGADVRPLAVDLTLAGMRGTLEVAGARLPFACRLVGAPHLENVLGAVATASALDVPPEAIAAGLAALDPPPGRLEQIHGPGFTVIVDYAHSPDALARVLDVLRPLARGALLTVFGCGGDRDRGKRPLMGEAAARRSDVLVLTSDNPRTEDPLGILADIEEGVRVTGMPRLTRPQVGRCGYLVEPDRTEAIARALEMARAGDLVLIAGKGHEDYQIVGREKRHLDDREEVRRLLGRAA